jgi:hypothetical protein
MKSGSPFLALVFTAFAGAALAKGPDLPQVQAQVLDQNGYPCNNCFFGANTTYYCFEADNKILIGYEKTPTINCKNDSKNDLTKVHKAWSAWAPEGTSIPLRYDAKNIWVTGPNGKSIKLKQDYTTDIFVNNSRCRGAVKKKSDD